MLTSALLTEILYFLCFLCITILITRLIVIDIAPLTLLVCNCPLFCNYPLADLGLPAIKSGLLNMGLLVLILIFVLPPVKTKSNTFFTVDIK